MKTNQLKTILLMTVMATIVFAMTYVNIYIPVLTGQGGLIHLGTLAMFLIAAKYGKYYGAFAGALGMTLFDLLSIWSIWAPGTLVVRLIAGYVMGLLAESKEGQGRSLTKNIFALLGGGGVIIVGYWIFEGAFLGFGLIPALSSVPGNVLQIVIAGLGLWMMKSMPEIEV
jgi:uncharacterized membrane protein